MKKLVLVLFLVLIQATFLSAQQLTLKDKFSAYVYQDINQDGFKDLVVLTQGNNLAVYYGQKDGQFSRQPNAKLGFSGCPRIDIADINNDGRPDFIFIYADKVSLAYQTPSADFIYPYHDLILTEGLQLGFEQPTLNVSSFAVDLNQDSQVDLLLPLRSGLAIYYNGAQGLSLKKPDLLLPLLWPKAAENKDKKALFSIAAQQVFYVCGLNQDKKPDLLIPTVQGVAIYLQNNFGQISVQPNQVLVVGDKMDQDTLAQAAYQLKLCALQPGQPFSLLASQIAGSLSERGFSLSTNIYVYALGKEGLFTAVPQQKVTINNFAPLIFMRDFNGNGRQDLILPAFKINVWSFIFGRGIGDERLYYVYLQDKQGKFPAQPSQTFATGKNKELLAWDINKDKLADVISYEPGKEQLTAAFQQPDGTFKQQPDKIWTLSAPLTSLSVLDEAKNLLIIVYQNPTTIECYELQI